MTQNATPGRFGWVLNLLLPALGLVLGYAVIVGTQSLRHGAPSPTVIEVNNTALIRELGAGSTSPVLLSRDDCPYCREAKVFLARRGIDVTLIEAPADPRVPRLVERVGTQGVPTLILADRVVEGFEEGAWNALFEN